MSALTELEPFAGASAEVHAAPPPPLRPKAKRRARRGPPGTPCPQCHKLCSLEDPEIESSSFDLDGSTINITASITRASACCGTETKRADLEGSVDIEHTCEGDVFKCKTCEELVNAKDDRLKLHLANHNGGALGFTTDEVLSCFETLAYYKPVYDDGVSEDVEGYANSGGRYAKGDVGISGTLTVECSICGESVTVDLPEGAVSVAPGEMEAA